MFSSSSSYEVWVTVDCVDGGQISFPSRSVSYVIAPREGDISCGVAFDNGHMKWIKCSMKEFMKTLTKPVKLS